MSRENHGFFVLLEMGLLSIIRKLRQEEREMRVLMLGLDGAGKVKKQNIVDTNFNWEVS